MKYCASTEFLLFPGKRALTLIHQFQRWGKITGKFAVHKPTVYRVGLNGLDPFIELCDFFSKNNQEQPFVTQIFTVNEVVIAAVSQRPGALTGAGILRVH